MAQRARLRGAKPFRRPSKAAAATTVRSATSASVIVTPPVVTAGW